MDKKHVTGLKLEKHAFQDEGNGIISFPSGQIIVDNTKMRNGLIYDIASMDLSEYNGQVTSDHVDSLDSVIGKALGIAKTDTAVTISGIQFAIKSNPYAQLAYDQVAQGFVTDLSVETYGPWPSDDDDTYYSAKLIGLSLVVVGNNKSARMKQLVRNSISQAKKNGLDTSGLEKIANEAEKPSEPVAQPEAPKVETPVVEAPKEEPKVEVSEPKTEPVVTEPEVTAPAETQEPAPVEPPAPVEVKQEQSINQEQHKMFVTIKNGRDFATKISYKNAAGETVETELAAGASVDVSEDQKEAVEKQINSANAPQPDLSEAIKEAVNAVTAPLMEEIKAIRQEAFDKKAVEPTFTKTENAAGGERRKDDTAENELNAMDYRERHALQIGLAWDALKGGDRDAMDKLRKINAFNLSKLKAEGMVQNSLSLGDFGNFVISRELLTDIQGIRTDYSPLIAATEWKETLSTQMAWLERSGDIDMQPVEFLDDATNGTWPNANLKPISNYSTNLKTADLEELAAVTPVMNAATRFLAADLLGDVAAGYRNDYDRKRAQLVIARLEQAIEANSNGVTYNYSSAAGGNVGGLVDLLQVFTKIGEKTPNGTYILGTSTYSEIAGRALAAGANGPLANVFTDGPGGIPKLFGRPYIIVSDDLLPRLGTNETRTFKVNGTDVVVNSSVFYANLSNFTGRTSGGLNYDLSMEAAYEDGGVVKSAFQRNEMVLRGSFFRGGAVKDSAQVASLLSPGIS